MTDHVFAKVSAVDWRDLGAVADAAEHALEELDANRSRLRSLAERVLDEPALLSLCEHYDILDKVVLHDDPTGWRLRLHVFLPGYFDRPHNHRWSYSSRILHGSYVHRIFGTDDQVGDDGIDVEALVPRLVRIEGRGSSYTLHHTMVHSVTASPYTTSLIVRGPAVKDRFVVTDRVTGTSWWQHGNRDEDPSESARKRMSREHAREVIDRLVAVGVLP